MKKLADALYLICITLWVGGMLATGYLAVPVLFAQIPDRMQAGNVAAAMFTTAGWLGIVCAVLLLIILGCWHGARVATQRVFQIVVLMLALGLIGQFVVQPRIAAIKLAALPLSVAESPLHADFARWHGVSSVLYLCEALLGVVLVVVQGTGRKPAA
ncbi:MAG: DUF4149 domain-containing protein [Rhodocyclaceae bacterium]|nr:DUF4149 domain-containing protein [Rhodocyclaceae bacterium]